MSNLKDILRELAIESGTLTAEEIGAEEFTVVTNETVTELEEEIQEIAEKTEEAADEIDQLIKYSDAIVATESIVRDRVEFLSQESVKVEYNRPLQAMTWVGVIDAMEAYSFPADMINDIREGVSFEAEEGESGAAQADKDKAKAESVIAKLKKFLASVWKALKHAVRRFLDLFITSNEKNKRSHAELISTINARTSSLASTDKLKVKGYKLLGVNGKVDAVAALRMVEAGFDKQLKTVYKAVEDILNSPSFHTDITKGKAGALALAKKLPKNASVALSGGREVRFATTVSGEGEGFSVNFGVVVQKDYTVEEEMDVPTFVELKSIAQSIAAVNARSDRAVADLSAMTAALEKAEKAIDTGITDNGDVARMDMSATTAAVNAVAKAASGFHPLYSKEAHKTVHAAYNYGLLVAGRYTKKGKEAK